jgi:hypothetical protein
MSRIIGPLSSFTGLIWLLATALILCSVATGWPAERMPCAFLHVEGHAPQLWCTASSQGDTIHQAKMGGLWIGVFVGGFLGLLPGLGLGALQSWQARTRAAMAEEMLSNTRIHLRESPRLIDPEELPPAWPTRRRIR